ncbi:MAG TPA: hypothetical protein VFB96_02065 [Pirellulaceae bacterium]|jgi:hypothetical protein|nr:hypothetical protein [Pirellulaceae bacterium]
MDAIRFHTTIGSDGIIRPPSDVQLAPGEVEVVVVPKPVAPPVSEPLRSTKDLIDALLLASAQVDWSGVPTDLAENHDHYAHGAPKGIDKQ